MSPLRSCLYLLISVLALSPPLAADTAFERRLLAPGIAEYSFTLRVGSGPFDTIGLHRVVRERAPFVPARTSDAVMLAHGDLLPFRSAFLSPVPASSDHNGLPVYLAKNGVDVWGIDFRWTRVPLATADLSFMADWGVETDAHDLGVALAVARSTRALTGQGFGKLHLLGWSRGGIISYAYLNGESQLPPALRQVKGFIPVDIYVKTDDDDLRAAACTRYALTQAQIDAGTVADASGQLFVTIGNLAMSAPGDLSPIVPGFTNEQVALLVGQATFLFIPGGLAPAPAYHFTGGTFDEVGAPTGLLYTHLSVFLSKFPAAAPWQPLKEIADSDAATCNGPEAPDVPWDDHLGDITVPTLYVGAGGGFGSFGVYNTTLLGSTDVSTLLVSLLPPEARIADFGHQDLFIADDAAALVWAPIRDWIEAH